VFLIACTIENFNQIAVPVFSSDFERIGTTNDQRPTTNDAFMPELKPARPGLEKLAASLLRGAPADEAPLIAWPLACGAQVAEKTRAVRYTGKVLTVEVPDVEWREQLRDLAPSYLGIFSRLLAGSVERIQFVLRGEQTPETR
jgi:hypothetical protein